jgi:hypothetical protein
MFLKFGLFTFLNCQQIVDFSSCIPRLSSNPGSFAIVRAKLIINIAIFKKVFL